MSDVTRDLLTTYGSEFDQSAARRDRGHRAAASPHRPPAWVNALGPADALVARLSPADAAPDVWTAIVVFRSWRREDAVDLPWSETYGKQSHVVADERGDLSLAEVELVKRLRTQGWNAYWMEAFGRAPARFRACIATPDELPSHVRARFLRVDERARESLGKPGSSGRPDIVAWRDRKVFFIEAKGPRDRVRPGQEAWAVAATEDEPASYGLVRWIAN